MNTPLQELGRRLPLIEVKQGDTCELLCNIKQKNKLLRYYQCHENVVIEPMEDILITGESR